MAVKEGLLKSAEGISVKHRLERWRSFMAGENQDKFMFHVNFPLSEWEAREYLLDSLRFYGAKVAQMPLGWSPSGTPDSWPSQFPEGTRIVFEVQVEDATRAAAVAKRLQEIREA